VFDKQIDDKYGEFVNHIRDFGFAMVVMPSVVKQLKGSYFLETGNFTDENSAINSKGTLP
jgi:hypothetical protein